VLLADIKPIASRRALQRCAVKVRIFRDTSLCMQETTGCVQTSSQVQTFHISACSSCPYILTLELGKFNRNYRTGLVERWKNFRGRTRDDHSKFSRRAKSVTRQLSSSTGLNIEKSELFFNSS